MKTVYTFLTAILICSTGFAKTYTLGSGKWNDTKVWNNDYAGTTIKANDIVIITGQVTVTEGLLVDGTLQIEKGASMVGMKDLVISKTGKLMNNGNTVMKRIINEGNIVNNLLIEAMMDIDNLGKIENNNNVLSGNNFDNYGGHADGANGAYYVNNTVNSSRSSEFGKDVEVFYGNAIQKSLEKSEAAAPMMLVASINSMNEAVLNINNPARSDARKFIIEKSSDGKNFVWINTVSAKGDASTAPMQYTDTHTGKGTSYYKVKVIGTSGQETVLPVASVKLSSTEIASGE